MNRTFMVQHQNLGEIKTPISDLTGQVGQQKLFTRAMVWKWHISTHSSERRHDKHTETMQKQVRQSCLNWPRSFFFKLALFQFACLLLSNE